MKWTCNDNCIVSLYKEGDDQGKHTNAAQAWCVASCDYKLHWPRQYYSAQQQNELFIVIVNRWIQEKINEAASPASEVCDRWLAEADAITSQDMSRTLPMCAKQCAGPVSRQAPVTMSEPPCNLPAGHVSITPVQIATIPFAMPFGMNIPTILGPGGIRRRLLFIFTLVSMAVVLGTGILVGQSIKSDSPAQAAPELPAGRGLVRVFSYSAWEKPSSDQGVCARCTDDSPSCIRRQAVFLSPVVGLFETSDIPTSELPLVFGTTAYVHELTERQMKQQWKAWNRDNPLPQRIERQTALPGNVQDCPTGVSASCLHNKGAVSARYCDFRKQCWSQNSVFGPGYDLQEVGADAHFMLRGRASFRLRWYSNTLCGSRVVETQHTSGPSHFSHQRRSFEIDVPEQCDTCRSDADPRAPGVESFDQDSGVVTCTMCAPMDILVPQLASRALCASNLVQMRCEECPVNTEPFGSSETYGVPLVCAACRGLVNAAGHAKGSHRPAGEVDCRNCSASSYFDNIACAQVQSMTIEYAGTLGEFTVTGIDSYKANEYFQRQVADDHWRDPDYQQQRCSCNNRHKFAQFCGGYAARDGDAWMQEVSSSNVVRLQLVGASDLDRFAHMRQGVCQPCEQCPVGDYNGLCVAGRKGFCAGCRALDDCPASPAHYLHHPHVLGCEQLHALADYECVRCKVWEKIGQDYMLLVGCGTQDLQRWTPTAESVDGVLDVVTCTFGSADAAECQHAGAQLERQRPFGNYSSLLPYCPPGWFFSCSGPGYDVFDAFSATCCTKCQECPSELKKKTGLWKVCSGRTDVDTQSSHCTARCENNMYESDGTCLFCNTCKEGEL